MFTKRSDATEQPAWRFYLNLMCFQEALKKNKTQPALGMKEPFDLYDLCFQGHQLYETWSPGPGMRGVKS